MDHTTHAGHTQSHAGVTRVMTLNWIIMHNPLPSMFHRANRGYHEITAERSPYKTLKRDDLRENNNAFAFANATTLSSRDTLALRRITF